MWFNLKCRRMVCAIIARKGTTEFLAQKWAVAIKFCPCCGKKLYQDRSKVCENGFLC